MGEARIKARVAARNTADEIHGAFLSDVSEQHPNHGADFAEALLERLADLLPKAQANQSAPAQSRPIARLGGTMLPFGKHVGQTFDETPLDYLDWLCRSQEEFYKDLRAYLTHPELESRRRASV